MHVPRHVDRIRRLAALAITERARSALRATGERVTPARLRVYVALLDSARALSHHELESALVAKTPVDRVTLYRSQLSSRGPTYTSVCEARLLGDPK